MKTIEWKVGGSVEIDKTELMIHKFPRFTKCSEQIQSFA